MVDRDPEHGPQRLPAQGGGEFVGQGRLAGCGVAVDPHTCRVLQPQREDSVGYLAEHLLPYRGHRGDDARPSAWRVTTTDRRARMRQIRAFGSGHPLGRAHVRVTASDDRHDGPCGHSRFARQLRRDGCPSC
jgi:hypothetical protein